MLHPQLLAQMLNCVGSLEVGSHRPMAPSSGGMRGTGPGVKYSVAPRTQGYLQGIQWVPLGLICLEESYSYIHSIVSQLHLGGEAPTTLIGTRKTLQVAINLGAFLSMPAALVSLECNRENTNTSTVNTQHLSAKKPIFKDRSLFYMIRLIWIFRCMFHLEYP